MSGLAEQAAGVLNQASEQVPIAAMQSVTAQLGTVISAIQQVGGGTAQSLGAEAQVILGEIQSFGTRLEHLKNGLDAAAQQMLQAGAG